VWEVTIVILSTLKCHALHGASFGSTLLLLYFLIYPNLNFTPSLKFSSSTNHFLLSLFHALASLLWLFLPGFRTSLSHSFSLYHPQPIHPPAFTAYSSVQCLGIIYLYGWLLHSFKSPHYYMRQLLLLLLSQDGLIGKDILLVALRTCPSVCPTAETHPPHREPIWNIISGLLPPTSKMVETGWTCPEQWESIEKRCRRLCLDILHVLKHWSPRRHRSAMFGNVRQWSAMHVIARYSINSPYFTSPAFIWLTSSIHSLLTSLTDVAYLIWGYLGCRCSWRGGRGNDGSKPPAHVKGSQQS